MIHVIATVETVPGQRAAFIEEFRRIVPAVHAEQGCVEYGATVDEETSISAQPPVRENVVVIIEKWQTLDDLEAHLIAPHMIEYRGRIQDYVSGVSLQILSPPE